MILQKLFFNSFSYSLWFVFHRDHNFTKIRYTNNFNFIDLSTFQLDYLNCSCCFVTFFSNVLKFTIDSCTHFLRSFSFVTWFWLFNSTISKILIWIVSILLNFSFFIKCYHSFKGDSKITCTLPMLQYLAVFIFFICQDWV